MKVDVGWSDGSDWLAPGHYGADGRWVQSTSAQRKAGHRWLDRVAGLAASRVKRLLGELVSPDDPGQRVSFDLDYAPAPTPWTARKGIGGHLRIELHLPDEIVENLSIDQAATLIQAWAGAAAQDRLKLTPRWELVDDGAFCFTTLMAVPRFGTSPQWRSNRDVDAFAKAVATLNGLWQRSPEWLTVMAPWPLLELVPDLRGGEAVVPLSPGRVKAAGITGFADLTVDQKLAVVLDRIKLAPSLGSAAEEIVRAIRREAAATGPANRWLSPPLLSSDGSSALRLEYLQDFEGTRVRAVINRAGDTQTSPWQPTGYSHRGIQHLPPRAGYDWDGGGRVWILTDPTTGRRLSYAPALAAADATAPSRAQAGDDLPEAHPAFRVHFTDPLYDDAGNDFAPFGSDEGFDLLLEWDSQRTELHADTTVAGLLADSVPIDLTDWTHSEPPVDAEPASRVDEAVFIQAAGFALLRLTGRIDQAGKQATLNALRYLAGFYDEQREYVTQRNDLTAWT